MNFRCGAEDSKSSADNGADRDLISALAGNRTDRECSVAHRTRRVVVASLGVMQEQKADRKRGRCVALAAMVLVVLGLGPLIWWITEDLVSDGLLSDLSGQFTLVVCILCPAIVAAALVAGWAHHRS